MIKDVITDHYWHHESDCSHSTACRPTLTHHQSRRSWASFCEGSL